MWNLHFPFLYRNPRADAPGNGQIIRKRQGDTVRKAMPLCRKTMGFLRKILYSGSDADSGLFDEGRAAVRAADLHFPPAARDADLLPAIRALKMAVSPALLRVAAKKAPPVFEFPPESHEFGVFGPAFAHVARKRAKNAVNITGKRDRIDRNPVRKPIEDSQQDAGPEKRQRQSVGAVPSIHKIPQSLHHQSDPLPFFQLCIILLQNRRNAMNEL